MDLMSETKNFLQEKGMAASCVDPEACIAALLEEMEEGLAGRPSSLKMYPTYLPGEGGRVPDGKAIALDAGGTHFRAALVSFQGGRMTVERNEERPMPGTKSEVTKEEFLDWVCDRLAPLLPESRDIGFCFSFPAEILPDGDGVLRAFDKEIRVTGSEGMTVCREIRERLAQRGMSAPDSFVLLNDTAAVLLGSMTEEENAGGCVGFVLGTGVNLCYCEPCERIGKLAAPVGGSMPINTEFGMFSRTPSGIYDLQLDAAAKNPGENKLEKMISGAYLGELTRLTLLGAAEEGLLGETASHRIRKLHELPLSEVSAFLSGSGDRLHCLCRTEDDAEVCRAVCAELVDRAAKLCVCGVSAAVLRAGLGTRKELPVSVAAEGSTFWKTKGLKERFDYWLGEMTEKKLGRCCRVVPAPGATMAGCAAAVLRRGKP